MTTQRMWLLGSDDDLRREESSEISARKTLKHLIENWREELSDDWDDSWDPDRVLRGLPG